MTSKFLKETSIFVEDYVAYALRKSGFRKRAGRSKHNLCVKQTLRKSLQINVTIYRKENAILDCRMKDRDSDEVYGALMFSYLPSGDAVRVRQLLSKASSRQAYWNVRAHLESMGKESLRVTPRGKQWLTVYCALSFHMKAKVRHRALRHKRASHLPSPNQCTNLVKTGLT